MSKIQDKLQSLYVDEEKSKEELLLEDLSPDISDIGEKIGGDESEEDNLEQEADEEELKDIAGDKDNLEADVAVEAYKLFKEQADRPDVSKAGEEAAEEKYGDVSFADSSNKKYPIDDYEHTRAAISYFGMPKNYSKYSLADRKTIAGKIAASAKKFGVELSDDWKKKHGITEGLVDDVKGYALAMKIIKAANMQAYSKVREDGNKCESMKGKDKQECSRKVMFKASHYIVDYLKENIGQCANNQTCINKINKVIGVETKAWAVEK